MTHEIVTADDGTARLMIEGELDAISVFDIRPVLDALVTKRPRRVEVDLSRLRIVDSSGVGALVSLYKRVRAQGGQVVVTGLQNQPLAIFRLLRLDRVMAGGDGGS
jgi:anti-sigma B factor antagonist